MYSGPGNQGYPYPPQGYPQGGYPQGGYPQGYPQGGYPQGYSQQPGYPPAGYGVPPVGPVGFIHPPGDPNESGMYGGTATSSDGPSGSGQFGFSDKTVRRAFVRKVYSLLMCMLLVATSFIAFMTLHEPTKRFLHSTAGYTLVIVSWVMSIVLMLVLACCEKARRTSPMNYIVLILFTLVMSFMTGATASRFDKNEVLMAFAITAFLCFALTIFAFQTRWDFTVMGGGLFIATLILMVLGFALMFMRSNIGVIIYSAMGAFLFSLYLIYDTQMIMGGKHKYSISPEEYIFAAITLFTDILTIFMDILTLISASRN